MAFAQLFGDIATLWFAGGTRKLSKNLMKAYTTPNQQGNRLCPVVFEITDTTRDDRPSIHLEFHPDLQLNVPRCIIYDRAVTDKSIALILESN
jgi:hypothetical protein